MIYEAVTRDHYTATCEVCGQYIITSTLSEAHKRGSSHEKVCGR